MHHSPLSLLSSKPKYYRSQNGMMQSVFCKSNDAINDCKRKHEVKMKETHELNRQVICHLFTVYAARGMTHLVKSPRTACDDRFRRPALLTLSTARRGCAQTDNCSRSRFIF